MFKTYVTFNDPKDTYSNILGENVKNTGTHKKLKIVFASSFKVYSELGGFLNFRYNISFIDPPLGGFGDFPQ
jgi:16S rRNA G966 N2-methylase RsmD